MRVRIGQFAHQGLPSAIAHSPVEIFVDELVDVVDQNKFISQLGADNNRTKI